jgi:hypothetical protein
MLWRDHVETMRSPEKSRLCDLNFDVVIGRLDDAALTRASDCRHPRLQVVNWHLVLSPGVLSGSPL